MRYQIKSPQYIISKSVHLQIAASPAKPHCHTYEGAYRRAADMFHLAEIHNDFQIVLRLKRLLEFSHHMISEIIGDINNLDT